MKKYFFLFLIFLILINIVSSAESPKLPTIISGKVLINDKLAKEGTEISARINNETISETIISEKGSYTLLIQEPTDKLINLYVNDVNTNKTVKWGAGQIEIIDLAITQETSNKFYLIIPLIILILIIFWKRKWLKRKSHFF